jgi:hypothetical protein
VPFANAVRVSTSTTHPALAELFTRLFSPHGHVDKYPRFKVDTETYEWNLQVILDESFSFLLDPRAKCREWVEMKDSTMLAYVAGLIDAEGNIRIYPNPRTIGIIVSVWNTDKELLEFAHKCLNLLGSRPMKPYLHARIGPIHSGFRIERKKEYWRVLVGRFDEAQSLLRKLPLQHREKVAMTEVALSVTKGDPYEKVADLVSSFKKAVKEERTRYTELAEFECLRTHPIVSSPVLCFLQKSAWHLGQEEHYERRLVSLRGFLATHEDLLCLSYESCVMLCPGCDETNIIAILVHESIHHALIWTSKNVLEPQDSLDELVQVMHHKGVVEQGFEFYG